MLLNLAYLPDKVITQVDFAKHGWREDFVRALEAYKQEWSETHGMEWKFQDAELEDMYNEYMEAQTIKDPKITKTYLDAWKAKQYRVDESGQLKP